MSVLIKNLLFNEHVLNYSLPQGSIIGPQGFILYTSKVGDIIRHHNICFRCYADDIQLYVSFDLKIPGNCEQVMERISLCIFDINRWMLRNKLQLNQDKTSFFLLQLAPEFWV